jgi:DnaJ-class molecular chaperone
MAEKSDYYEALGVAKNASVEEIKAAFKKAAMRYHPDMLRNKSPAEQAAAPEKLKLATEAYEVLIDTSKRATYDSYGHQGLENIKNTNTSSNKSTTGPSVKAKMHTEEDTFSFFEKRAESNGSNVVGSDGLTAQQRRDKNAEERRNRNKQNNNTANNNTPSTKETFNEVAENVVKATEQLKTAALPVDVLERFRDNLQDFLREVDAAIVRARKNTGPNL